jgi:prophage regulatory protein
MPTLMDMETMLGPAELVRLLGVSRQRVTQMAARADFPRPRFVLTMGSIWALDDVQAWADKRGRILNLEALTTDVQAGDDSTP